MKTVTLYETFDRKIHKTKEKAENHLRRLAYNKMESFLRDFGVTNPQYKAKKIIEACFTDGTDLGKPYYDLFEIMTALKDAHIVTRSE